MQKDTYETIKMFSDPLSFHFKFDSRLTVKNLQFSEINGVHWNNFTDSVFRFGATKQITGKKNYLYHRKKSSYVPTQNFIR